mgnify:CR=1 FL=1
MQLTNRRVRLMGTVIDVSIYHERTRTPARPG